MNNATKNETSLCLSVALAIAAATFTFAARAAEVSTVSGLVDALANASDGDEIVIAAKAEPYDLSTVPCMNKVGHLYVDKCITLRGETGVPADVVLQGSTNRILYLYKEGCTISGITFKNGDCTENVKNTDTEPRDNKRGGAIYFRQNKDAASVSNCAFVGNKASSGGAVGSHNTVVITEERWTGQFFDCMFTNNVAVGGQGGAAYNIGLARGCSFVDNHVSGTPSNESQGYQQSGQAVFQAHWLNDCDFIANGSSSQYFGAVYNFGTVASTNQTIANCRFERNISKSRGAAIGVYNDNDYNAGKGMLVVGCTFATNSVADRGGAIYNLSNVRGCTFIGNSANVAGAADESAVYGCNFVGNKSSGTYSGAIAKSAAFDCSFTGNAAAQGAVGSNSSFVRCIFGGNICNGAGQYITYNSSFDSCRITNETGGVIFAQNSHVTNTLVTACSGVYLVGNNDNYNISMVNCTVVSNSFSNFAPNSSNTGDMHVLNSLFFGNTVNNADYDIGSNAQYCLKSVSNSVFSVQNDAYVPAGALSEGANNLRYTPGAFNPRFVGPEVAPDDPYALTLRSPCVKDLHGQVQGWMATATDIRGDGFPRLREGVVDIGCYQCWDKAYGLSIFVR